MAGIAAGVRFGSVRNDPAELSPAVALVGDGPTAVRRGWLANDLSSAEADMLLGDVRPRLRRHGRTHCLQLYTR